MVFEMGDRGYHFDGFSDSVNGFKFADETAFSNSIANGVYADPSLDLDFNYFDALVLPEQVPPVSAQSSARSVDGLDSPSDDGDFSETVLKYVSQMLMEEEMEEKPCMFHDPLALQAAEKTLYDVLGDNPPLLPDQFSSYADQFLVDSPDGGALSSFSDYSSSSSYGSNTISSVDHRWNREFAECKPSFMQMPLPTDFVFQSTANSNIRSSLKFQNGLANNMNGGFMNNMNGGLMNNMNGVLANNTNGGLANNINGGLTNNNNGVMGLSNGKAMLENIFSESDLALQFKRGVEEANKFLPKENPLVLDLEATPDFKEKTPKFLPKSNPVVLDVETTPELKEKTPKLEVKIENEDNDYFLTWFRGKKNHEREDDDSEEEQSNKHLAVYEDEGELAEMFDKMLVCTDRKCGQRPPNCKPDEAPQESSVKPVQQNGRANGLNSGKARTKRQGDNNKEVVDLRNLLLLCAQAVSSADHRTANELLKQIWHHSSPLGDGSQRLAHCFANGLEARLAGTGTQIYTALSAKRNSAADMLKAHLAYVSACPFVKMAIIFANHNILKLAEEAETLHIIDFGILYGFQWPALIYRLSKRPGGPPKLRITGIELPQSGFRPAERVEETGRRLEKYCERHNVPFEYNAIAQKWETIRVEDLKINNGEVCAVNCLYRFKNLLDETVVVSSPRNAVLKLIKKVKPNLFVQSIVNGSYNAPFFISRFKEALFHFSALFDVCDTNMSREDHMRLKFEKEFFGREAMNVIACEGSERVERPENYKQWQVRNTRAGFKQLPLDPLAMRKLKGKVKASYHSDFTVDEDGHWALQGWKGRILFASSAWVPA